jgi:hypothetical protein
MSYPLRAIRGKLSIAAAGAVAAAARTLRRVIEAFGALSFDMSQPPIRLLWP